MSVQQPLITKYRPSSFEEVIGHEPVLAALRRAMAADTCPHAYLFTGPAGTGKTTLSRIVAADLKCEVVEIDAASNSGVDDMRQLVELGNHVALSGAGRRAFIIDECHTLSKSAWQAILKLLEEPPDHLFICLCTTEREKVPETIQTRCYNVVLRPVKPEEMGDLLEAICALEEWQVKPDVMSAVIQAATGQPRKALTILQSVYDADSREEVSRIVSLLDASNPMIELMQTLMKSAPTWSMVQPILARLEEADFESGIIPAGRYVAAALMKTKSDKEAARYWAILDAMTFPTTTYDRQVHFLTAIGRLFFGGA